LQLEEVSFRGVMFRKVFLKKNFVLEHGGCRAKLEEQSIDRHKAMYGSKQKRLLFVLSVQGSL
jgi:hypothetical protein